MIKVLFLGENNLARSQMAEAFLNEIGGSQFEASSAGLHDEKRIVPTQICAVMEEVGLDLRAKESHSVFDYYKEERHFDVVISLCDRTAGQRCPVFPSTIVSLHWEFADPLATESDEAYQVARQVRDNIKLRIEEFIRVFQLM